MGTMIQEHILFLPIDTQRRRPFQREQHGMIGLSGIQRKVLSKILHQSAVQHFRQLEQAKAVPIL